MLLHSQPFRTRDALPLITQDVVLGPRYTRLMHGAHQEATADLSHGRLIQGFRATHDDEFVLLGRSAAWAHAACFASADEPVVVAIPSRHRLSRTAAVVPHLARLAPAEVASTQLGPATSLGRTAVDLARGLGSMSRPFDDRVADVDALIRATSLTPAQARAATVGCARLRGMPTARRVLELVSDGVDSRPETRLRLLILRAGLPAPLTQCPVTLDGRVVARLDLGWPELRVGLEYDGAGHTHPDQVRVDLRRHNLVRQAGWAVLQVDRHQVRRPDVVLRQLVRLMTA